MKLKIIALSALIVLSAILSLELNAQMNSKMEKSDFMMPDIEKWPEASKMAAEEMINKYGQPQAGGEAVLGWMNKGDWKMIHVNKNETKHSFPIEHTDMLEQCISYKVPTDKMDELGIFDGSITFDRTQGLMCARCDKEGNNLLALNLANDIVTGKKTVEEARKVYGDIVKEKMNGGNPLYMQKLAFSPHSNAADADKNTIGLTKEDMMKGMKKTAGEKEE